MALRIDSASFIALTHLASISILSDNCIGGGIIIAVSSFEVLTILNKVSKGFWEICNSLTVLFT